MKKLIAEAGLPARVLLLAVWDKMPSLIVAKARGLGTPEGHTHLTAWAKAQTAAGRSKAEAAASKAVSDSAVGLARAQIEALGDALMLGLKEHPSTRFARQMEATPLADVVGRKHRGAGSVLGMSRRMVCHYRRGPAYAEALAIVERFKRQARAAFLPHEDLD